MKTMLILWVILLGVVLNILLLFLFVLETIEIFMWSAKFYAKHFDKKIGDGYLQVKNAKTFKYYVTFNDYYYDENKNEDVVWYMNAFWSKDGKVLFSQGQGCHPLYVDLCKQYNIPIETNKVE